MTRRSVYAILVGIAMAGAALVAPLLAQQPPTQNELLAEVRLLRQAIESLAGVNARVQIVFGRLELQEQRTTAAGLRLDQARAESSRITRELTALQERQKRFEVAVAESRRPPDEMEQMRAEGRMVAQLIEQLESDHARALANETEAASALNQEQGRWSDLNRQLEELERMLIKR